MPQAIPIRPSMTGSGEAADRQASRDDPRSNRRAVAVLAAMFSLTTSTRRRASVSGCGQLCAKTGDKPALPMTKTSAALIALRCVRLRLDVFRFEVIAGVAELTGHLNGAILHHMVPVVLRKTAQHFGHVVA